MSIRAVKCWDVDNGTEDDARTPPEPMTPDDAAKWCAETMNEDGADFSYLREIHVRDASGNLHMFDVGAEPTVDYWATRRRKRDDT